ncbi:MAG: hypothetical protein EZS28_021278 [Streblomastix strix]|uniref:Uncharacterized protein n=1 Tax=Streblomastix strix TaxID=222440 RepID=A0A5J4VKS5_9EUKA|nr:MAG: hypothetical protein EZS28_021278 [Streblomastix strix]
MNPATRLLRFGDSGVFDPVGRFAQASRLSVSQRQKGTTPSRVSLSNYFHCPSEIFRSLGLRISVGRQFFSGQKKVGPFLIRNSLYYPDNKTLVLHIVVVSVIFIQIPFPLHSRKSPGEIVLNKASASPNVGDGEFR